MTKIADLICVMMLITVSSLVLFNIPSSVKAGGPPPPDDGINGLQYIDGDWDVSGVESYTDEIIVLTGNLTILNGGTLTFNNVNLRMNNTLDNGIYNIVVESGGTFNILAGSNITDSTFDVDDGSASDFRFLFWVKKDSDFTMTDSVLNECGWGSGKAGLTVDTDGTTFINDTIDRCKVGIFFNQSSNHTVIDSRFTNIGSGSGYDGIFFYYSSNNIVSNCYFENNVAVGTSINTGSNNTINNCTYVNSKIGIAVGFGDNNTISDIKISYSQPDGGIKLYSAENNTFSNVTITDTPRMVYVEVQSYNNTFEDFTLINSTYGYFTFDSCRDNKLINSTIINSTSSPIYLDLDSHLTVLNTSFDESKVFLFDIDSSLEIQWYLHVKVKSPPDTPIQDANVMVYNITDDLIADDFTASDGFLSWIEVTERIQYKSGNVTYTPHNISATKASKTGYVDPEPNINFSQVVEIVLNLGVPSAPQNLITSTGDSYINLSWDAPSSDGGSSVTNYVIYKGTSSGGEVFLTEIGNLLYYNDTPVTNGVTYYYMVSAKNAIGEGLKSNEADATAGDVPSVLQNLIATAGDGYVNISWEAPSDDGGFPVTNYRIYKGTSVGGEVFLIEIGDLLYYNDTAVTNGIPYYYKVNAKNAQGEGPESNEAVGTPGTGETVPSAPQNLQASSGDSYVYLEWEAPSSDGGSSITNYEIYRGTSAGGEVFLIEIGNVLVYNDTTVTNDVTYYYKVSANNGIGEGLQSNEVNATPEEPGIPTNQPPTASISSHSSGATVTDTVTISGTASDPDGTVQRVEIKIDSGSWITVSGTSSWSYSWDTTAVSNGEHTIFIRSFDGTNYSSEASITLNVNNPKDDGDGFDMTLLLLVIIIIVVIVVVVLLMMKRRNPGGKAIEKISEEEDKGPENEEYI